MTPEALAALHRRCFEATPRPWSASEFAALLADPATLVVHTDDSFALGRLAGPEAELLTLVVDPDRRRRGTATTLMAALEADATARGACELFLEVAATNAAARALYAGLGYRQAGLRTGYYTRPDGPAIDALVLVKTLTGAEAGAGKTI